VHVLLITKPVTRKQPRINNRLTPVSHHGFSAQILLCLQNRSRCEDHCCRFTSSRRKVRAWDRLAGRRR